MRKLSDHINCYRVKVGLWASDDSFGMTGAFEIPFESYTLHVIATDGQGVKPQWEHVSVSLQSRCPNWKEMCFIKDLFWGDDEVVMQLHPAKKDYVNQHPYCLHLWKPVEEKIPTPPSILVGTKKGEISG